MRFGIFKLEVGNVLFVMEVMVVGDLNLMISNFNNMKISPYEEGLKVKDKQIHNYHNEIEEIKIIDIFGEELIGIV